MYDKIKTKKDYDLLLKSGMMWEFHPELTGNWEEDIKLINPLDLKENETYNTNKRKR